MAEVSENGAKHRYEISVNGALAGFAQYVDHGNVRTFVHTEIDPAYEGQGLGGQLVGQALDDARKNGLAVVPVCPFVRAFIKSHPAYAELVPVEERARLAD